MQEMLHHAPSTSTADAFEHSDIHFSSSHRQMGAHPRLVTKTSPIGRLGGALERAATQLAPVAHTLGSICLPFQPEVNRLTLRQPSSHSRSHKHRTFPPFNPLASIPLSTVLNLNPTASQSIGICRPPPDTPSIPLSTHWGVVLKPNRPASPTPIFTHRPF